MTRLDKTYHCKQRNKDNITIESLDYPYLAGDLVVSVVDKMVSDYDAPAQVALSRADALSLAWDIIEHFEDGTRPKPVIKAGDYVKSSTGLIGRVKSIHENVSGEKMLYADTLMGRHLWSMDYVSPADEQEFIDHYSQRVEDITNREI